MVRPNIFPDNGRYAIFSNSDIFLNNGSVIRGDIWANRNITFDNNSEVDGDLTAAQGWLDMNKSGASVTGDVWTGASNAAGWAINLGNNTIGGSVKASASVPCSSGMNPAYGIVGGGSIAKNLTTWGTFPNGTVGGTSDTGHCTTAPAPQTLEQFPQFRFDPRNYGCDPYPSNCPSTYHEFSSVASFKSYVVSQGNILNGTYWVQDPAPSETNRIEFDTTDHVRIAGDTTIVTNTPVLSKSVDDGGVTNAKFIVVSHYSPDPAGTPCSLSAQADGTECAIHFWNTFQPGCHTKVLLYSDKGPVAIKNQADMCGSVIGDLIQEQNGWHLTYDESLHSVPGFGPDTWEIGKWQELPAG